MRGARLAGPEYYKSWADIPQAVIDDLEDFLREHPYEDYTYNGVAQALGWDFKVASQVLRCRAHDPQSGVLAFTRHRLPKGAKKPAAGETLGKKMESTDLYKWSPLRKQANAGSITMRAAIRAAIIQALQDHPLSSHRQLTEWVKCLLGTVDRMAVEERIKSGIAKGVLLAEPGPRGAELVRLTK
jgi:hypothetical protein